MKNSGLLTNFYSRLTNPNRSPRRRHKKPSEQKMAVSKTGAEGKAKPVPSCQTFHCLLEANPRQFYLCLWQVIGKHQTDIESFHLEFQGLLFFNGLSFELGLGEAQKFNPTQPCTSLDHLGSIVIYQPHLTT